MDESLRQRTAELAKEMAQNLTTIEEVNSVMRSLMSATLERMLNTEDGCSSGTTAGGHAQGACGKFCGSEFLRSHGSSGLPGPLGTVRHASQPS